MLVNNVNESPWLTLVSGKKWRAQQVKRTRQCDPSFIETIDGLEKKIRDLKIENLFLKKNVRKLNAESEQVQVEKNALQNKLKESEEKLRNVWEEFGRVSYENDQKAIEKRRKETFEKLFKSNVVDVCPPPAEAAQLPRDDGASTSAAVIQSPDVEASENVKIKPAIPVNEEIPENNVVREESSNREGVSLTCIPSTAVEKSIYNNYKLLLLVISDMLLSSEIAQFKDWARDMYDMDLSNHVYEGFLELDRKGIISASDLTKLRSFFETMWRIDLVHLIDCFLQGDYTNLQRSVSSRKNNNPSRNTRTVGLGAISSIANPKRSLTLGRRGAARNFGTSQGVEESFTAKAAEVENSQLMPRHSTLGNCRTQNIEGAFGTNINRMGLVVSDGVTRNNYGKIKRERAEIKESLSILRLVFPLQSLVLLNFHSLLTLLTCLFAVIETRMTSFQPNKMPDGNTRQSRVFSRVLHVSITAQRHKSHFLFLL